MTKFNSRVSKLLLGDTEVYVAKADDGGVFTTETTEAQDDTVNDMTLLPAVPVQEDAYYFGSEGVFGGVLIDIGTQGDGTWTIVWEYWDGDSWETLGASDETVGFTAATGRKVVTWAIPSDWATTSVDSVAKYWARARVSAFSSVTTQPKGTRAWVLKDMSQYLTETSGLPGERETSDSTTFGDAGRERLDSIENGTFRIAGFFDDQADSGPDAVLGPLLTNTEQEPFEYGPSGNASGDERYSGFCWIRRYELTARVAELVGFTAEAEVHGQVTRGSYT